MLLNLWALWDPIVALIFSLDHHEELDSDKVFVSFMTPWWPTACAWWNENVLADVPAWAWTSDPQPFPEAYYHVGQAELGTLRFREEKRGCSRAPELPCQGMGCEKAKQIGPPPLRKHLMPPTLAAVWARNQGDHLWPRYLTLYIQIRGHLIDEQNRQMYWGCIGLMEKQ